MDVISPVPGYLGSQAKDCVWLEEAFKDMNVTSFHDASAGGLAFPYYMYRKGYKVTTSDISYISYYAARAIFDGPKPFDIDATLTRSGYATGLNLFSNDIANWIDGIIGTYNSDPREFTVKLVLLRTLLHFTYRGYSWDKKMIRSTSKERFLEMFKIQYNKVMELPKVSNGVYNNIPPMDWKSSSYKYVPHDEFENNLFFVNPDLPFTDGKPFGHFTLYEDIDSILEQRKVEHPKPINKTNVMDELNSIYQSVKNSGNYHYIAILFEDNAYPDSVTATMWMQEKGGVKVYPSPGRFYSLGRQPHIVYLVVGVIDKPFV